MDEIIVVAGQTVVAAFSGEQAFHGGGTGSAVRLNGNPHDYRLEHGTGTADLDVHELVARNGSGRYRIGHGIERVWFVGGAFSLTRNLPAIIPADAPLAWGAAPPPFTSHAQIREDVLLMRALHDVEPTDGFYIDVGAYDPDEDTVTRAFYDRGWRGINLEPSRTWFDRLEARRPRDINICAAASTATGTMLFYANDGAQLGTLERRFASHEEDGETVATVALADICARHAPAEIHFLKIDVEGHERAVLEGMDLSRHRPWILVIEAVAPNRADIPTFGEWEDILLDAHYRFAAADELNRYYVAEERSDLARFFCAPVDNYVTARHLREHDALKRRISELEDEVARPRDVAPVAR